MRSPGQTMQPQASLEWRGGEDFSDERPFCWASKGLRGGHWDAPSGVLHDGRSFPQLYLSPRELPWNRGTFSPKVTLLEGACANHLVDAGLLWPRPFASTWDYHERTCQLQTPRMHSAATILHFTFTLCPTLLPSCPYGCHSLSSCSNSLPQSPFPGNDSWYRE